MTKFLIIVIIATFASNIAARNTCLDLCGAGCFVDSVSERCMACPSGCISCKDPDTCITCLPGYYLNDKKNCVSCNVTGCANCTGNGVCTECQSGYFLENSSSCQFCGTLCKTCASSSHCETCRSDLFYGVYRSNRTGDCKYCPEGCSSCKSSGACTACAKGYVLSDFQCVSCSVIDPDCVSCDESLTQCNECGAGRYLLNNTCLECSSGCENCTDDSTCNKCSEGYYLNANDGCSPCMANCKLCKNSLTCAQCEDGYGYDSDEGRCVACKLDCEVGRPPASPASFSVHTRTKMDIVADTTVKAISKDEIIKSHIGMGSNNATQIVMNIKGLGV